MKHDIFEFNHDMTKPEKFWRAAFLTVIVAVLILNVFFWGPV